MIEIPRPGPAGRNDIGTFTFSQASLQDYADCPRRFQLRYLCELVWPGVGVSPFSVAEQRNEDARLFHRLVQQHMMGLPARQLEATAQAAKLARWWTNFVDSQIDLADFEVHPERSLVANVDGFRLIAKFDLIAVRQGEAIIYDWKTYSRRPRDEHLARRWQSRIYPAMLVRAGSALNGGTPLDPEAISMIYWFAEFPSDPFKLVYDNAKCQRDWDAIEMQIRQIAATGQFPLTDNLTACRFCSYRSLCDRGVEAGPLVDAEAQIADSDGLDQPSRGAYEPEE